MKRRPGRRGERDRRRRPCLASPPPLNPFGGGSSLLVSRRPPGSSAGLREEFLRAPSPAPAPEGGGVGGTRGAGRCHRPEGEKNKQTTFFINTKSGASPNVTCPGRSGPRTGRKHSLERETQEEEKRREGSSAAAAASASAARKRPGWPPAWCSDTSPRPRQERARRSRPPLQPRARRRQGSDPLARRRGSWLTREWPRGRGWRGGRWMDAPGVLAAPRAQGCSRRRYH